MFSQLTHSPHSLISLSRLTLSSHSATNSGWRVIPTASRTVLPDSRTATCRERPPAQLLMLAGLQLPWRQAFLTERLLETAATHPGAGRLVLDNEALQRPHQLAARAEGTP